jgi:hypothetical protein
MPMFLTAVLQGHTDSLPRTDDSRANPNAVDDDTIELPQLDEALAIPLKDRVQPLPSAHRSRWV